MTKHVAPGNEFIAALLGSEDFIQGLKDKFGKADTISQATGLLWYDLRPVVQMLYPFKELIPRISRLPRVPADGGNAFHWKRITGINVNNISLGVSEGNRGGRISITEQDQTANYKTLGLESSVTFQARWGSKNLDPEALGIAIQSTLRSTMIGEEQTLFLGNASSPLGITPTPTLAAAGTSGNWGGNVTVYVMCVALGGFGFLNYTAYNSATQQGGVPGQITRTNADGSLDTFGGGSAQPSAENSLAGVTTAQVVTATVTPVVGAVAYAWYVSTTSGGEKLVALTQGNQIKLTQPGASTAQPVTALKVGANYQDNSLNLLLPDGILSQMYGAVFGAAPGTAMTTNPNLPSIANGTISIATSGSILCQMNNANSGLTFNGTNIVEIDAVLQAAYDQYKIGFDRIIMSSLDILNMGQMLNTSATSMFRILFEADKDTGKIVAGRRVTSYYNKFFGNTLDIEIHPFVPPGTVIFWSDRVPYELSGVANILEAHVRQDYYQLQWPFRTMRYEFGVYVDEVFAGYFPPAFAAITNLNPPTGTPSY